MGAPLSKRSFSHKHESWKQSCDKRRREGQKRRQRTKSGCKQEKKHWSSGQQLALPFLHGDKTQRRMTKVNLAKGRLQ